MNKINTAMILAAGLGTRMRGGNTAPPKPLTEINLGGRQLTLLDFILREVIAAGIKNIVINTHHKAEAIHSHLDAHYKKDGIIISHEKDMPLETGGGVKNAMANNPALFAEPFLVCNADILWNTKKETLPALINKFDKNKMDALLLCVARANTLGFAPDRMHDFIMDNKNQLTRSTDNSGGVIFCGTQILAPQIFNGTDEEIFSLNKIYNAALGKRRLYGHRLDGRFYHIGTPEAVRELNQQ